MKLKPRKIAEAVAEKILMASGYLTSIVIVLIVVFLFREGAGLFDSPAVEQGYVLAVNRANPVQSLTPEQIMQIFDADLTNWSEVGGPTTRFWSSGSTTSRATRPSRSSEPT